MKTLKLTGFLLAFVISTSMAQNVSFNMEVTTPKSKEPIVMKVATSPHRIAMEPVNMGEMGKMKIVIDNDTKMQYVLMENNGQKTAMSVNPFIPDNVIAKAKEPTVSVTKEMKTIDGYKCNKVIVVAEDVTSELWLTQEAGLNYADLYKIFNSAKSSPAAQKTLPPVKNIQGFPIEIISKDKAKAESVVVRIKNISHAKVDAQYFSIDGYKVVDMTKQAPKK